MALLGLAAGCAGATKSEAPTGASVADSGRPSAGSGLPDADTGPSDDSGTPDTGTGTGTPPETAIEGRACPPDSPLTWGNFGEALLLTHCTGCHSDQLAEGTARGGAPLGVDFNTHTLAQAWLPRIYARSADANTTMPPVDTLSSATREELGDWLACGAP